MQELIVRASSYPLEVIWLLNCVCLLFVFYPEPLAQLKAACEVSNLPAAGGTWQACSVGMLAVQLVGLLLELTGNVSHAGQMGRNWWDFHAMQGSIGCCFISEH